MDIAYKQLFLKWFGQNLKRARKENGYSQESLAELAGMDLSYYGAVPTSAEQSCQDQI